ncbi:uncharacterized protein N0V89_006740 [Didymosphaeria variabile]|uniref:Ankyrin n=1 Tax=Didymosphaeria variabile TaxID=1932322 RepID=A0A9W9C9K8_9PLEO|nr:uncharacterized protein N0V89_006740 [Didymosphaeria variabile]KAJ4351398.1 hypothetical protein N0V89_006740 [Didymosphaeria variabile]
MALVIDLIERDIPSPGSGDWGQWYDNLLGKKDNLVLVENEVGVLGTNTAVAQVIWGDEARNIVVQGLHGCFALFCISPIGAFVAHFWERPSVVDVDGRFEPDIINILRHYLASKDNVYQLGPNPFCYIMGGTYGAIAENGADEQDTLTQSDSMGMRYRPQYNRIRDTILDILPRASVEGFAYRRQVNDEFQTLGYGKGAVLYDPIQKERPADVPEENWSSEFGTVAVYLQGYKATQIFLSKQEIQIWRLHSDPTSWTNAAIQANRDTLIDPCDTGRDNGIIRRQDIVERGSEVTDVTKSFDILLGDGHFEQFSCTYKGGPYAPTAQSGAVAGELTCAVGEIFTNDSTILLDQAISQLSAKDLPTLYDRLLYRAIRHNAVDILKDLITRGVDIRPRLPSNVRDANTETLQLLLENGWDISSTAADDKRGAEEQLPFLWHVLDRKELVEWGLEHGAHTSVQFPESTSQRHRLLHETLLEKCVSRCIIPTYELLRSHGAPHGRRELHIAVERATYGPIGNGERDEQWYREHMDMVQHLLDVVKLDVNAPDQPPDIAILPMHRGGNGRSAGPICYIPTSSMLEKDTRELTWMLLDRGADPEQALGFAKKDYPRFIEDVEAWRRERKKSSRGCCVQ